MLITGDQDDWFGLKCICMRAHNEHACLWRTILCLYSGTQGCFSFPGGPRLLNRGALNVHPLWCFGVVVQVFKKTTTIKTLGRFKITHFQHVTHLNRWCTLARCCRRRFLAAPHMTLQHSYSGERASLETCSLVRLRTWPTVNHPLVIFAVLPWVHTHTRALLKVVCNWIYPSVTLQVLLRQTIPFKHWGRQDGRNTDPCGVLVSLGGGHVHIYHKGPPIYINTPVLLGREGSAETEW